MQITLGLNLGNFLNQQEENHDNANEHREHLLHTQQGI